MSLSLFQRCLVLALLFFFIVTGGHLYYKREAQKIQMEKYQDLAAIAQEKARFVTSWLTARARDAARPSKSSFFRKAMEEWLKDPAQPSQLEAWKKRLSLEKEDFGYDDVLVLAPDGWRVLLSAKEDPDPVELFTREAASMARKIKGPVLSEPYMCSKGTIHLDVVSPVFTLDGEELLAFWVLRADLGKSFYPSVQSWPTPSFSAETLIVKQEGDHVLFLNQLGHSPKSALSLRIPLEHKELPAVQAILGRTGMFLGKDYRGVEVLADLRPISGTSWFMVTKMDGSEILEEASYRGAVVALFVAFTLLLFGSILALWVRHSRARLWKKLYSSEHELRLAHEGLRTILYSIGDAVIATDKKGDVRLMNPVAEALTGWEEKEATGRNLEEVFRIINEDTRLPVENPVHRVLREGLTVGLANHTILISKDGMERPIADSSSPVRDEKGEIEGVVLVFRDQTEERRLRRELERSRREWEEIFQAVGHPTIVLDRELRILAANQAALKRSGLGEDEILGRRCYEVFHASKKSPEGCSCKKLLEGYSGKLTYEECEKDRFYLVSCTAVLDDQGCLEKIIHVATDITELQEVREALRLSEERFRSLVEKSPQGILVVQEERIRYANTAALRLLEASMEQILQAHYLDFTHPEYKELIADRYRKRELGEPVSAEVEFKLLGSSGKGKWVMGSTASISWDGKPGHLVFLQDLSGQKKMQEEREKLERQFLQAQKMEAVGRLAGGVAHDFNNMLSIVTGYCELALRQAQGNKPLERYLKEILNAAGRSATLIRQLMAFARKQVISPKPLDLNQAIGGMLKMLKRLIGEDIELQWIPGQELWTVFMDSAQLDQILANLMVNARDAIAGTGKVIVETQNLELDPQYCREHPGFVPGQYVMLAVTDDGCGMDRETLERIFEPFFTTKAMDKGTGLGLSTVYGIVKQNGGFINVYSEPGKGTTFKIYLPRHQPEPEEVSWEEEPSSLEALPRGTETVLLVEDEPSLIRVYKKFLATLGYKVLSASSPQEALALADAHQGEIHLLLTDVVMPQMNGKELLELLKKSRPGIKCLFMSGYTADAIAHHGVLDQGVKFLGKPFTLQALASKLRETAGNS